MIASCHALFSGRRREKPSFDRSLALTERLHRLIPGGAHTYAKGDDQYSADTPPILVRGEGARVWDVDGNERAVSLGHAFAAVNQAAARQMRHGSNFSRPALLEHRNADPDPPSRAHHGDAPGLSADPAVEPRGRNHGAEGTHPAVGRTIRRPDSRASGVRLTGQCDVLSSCPSAP